MNQGINGKAGHIDHIPQRKHISGNCDRRLMRPEKGGCGDSEQQRRKDPGSALYIKAPPVKGLTSGSSQDASDEESGQDKKEVNADPPIVKPEVSPFTGGAFI